MIGYRARKRSGALRRGTGIALATIGLCVWVRFLPPDMWLSLIGLVLIWAGWGLFKN